MEKRYLARGMPFFGCLSTKVPKRRRHCPPAHASLRTCCVAPNRLVPPAAPNAGVLAAPNRLALEAAPKAGAEAPKAGVLEAAPKPNAGAEVAPKAGADVAPKAGADVWPNPPARQGSGHWEAE